MKLVLSVVLVLLSVLCTHAYCPADRTAKLYGVDGAGLGSISGGSGTPGDDDNHVPSSLYIIDPEDGSFELVGLIGDGYNHTIAIAACPFTSALYAVDNGNSQQLLKLDSSTGAATPIGPTGGQIADMAFGPDGTLYGWLERNSVEEDRLVTISTETGAFTLLDDFGTETRQSGVAVDHSGVIWMKRDDFLPGPPKNFLHRLTSTGLNDASVEMSSRTGNLLAYSPDGMLYTATRDSPNANIQIINPDTGMVSTVSTTAIPRLAGFTFRCETGPTGGAAIGAIIGIIVGFLVLLCCCWCCMAWMSDRARKGN